MPIYDFFCDFDEEGCGNFLENEYLTFDEFDKMKAEGGLLCKECGRRMHIVPANFKFDFAPVLDKRGHLIPGSKRGRRRMMEQRYIKRNARIEAMPKHVQDRLVRFAEKYGVNRFSPPHEPDHA